MQGDSRLDALCDILGFAARHLARLDGYTPHWAVEDPFVRLQDKVLVETALLLLVTSRLPEETARNVTPSPREIAATLAPMIRSDRNRLLLMRYPHVTASLGIAHAALERIGCGDDEWTELLRRNLATGHVASFERLPFRAMELLWLQGLLGETDVDFSALLRHSVLTSAGHPMHMAPADMYALTHAVMYVTDFGRVSAPPAVDAGRVMRMVESCISWALLSDHLDLLAEALMCTTILGRTSAYSEVAWARLWSVWDEVEFLPSPSFDVRQYETLPAEARPAYSFEHVYHTNYVWGLLCALDLALDTSSMPPPRVEHPSAADPCDVVSRHLARRRSAKGPREGLGWFCDRARSPSADVCAVFMDGLLVEAARSYSLATLAEMLADAATSPATITWTFSQCLEFLLRQRTPAGGFVGSYAPGSDLARTIAELDASVTASLERLERQLGGAGVALLGISK